MKKISTCFSAFRDKYLAARISILTVMVILFCFSASAQFGYTDTVKSYGNQWMRGKFIKALHVPFKKALTFDDIDSLSPQVFVQGLNFYYTDTLGHVHTLTGGSVFDTTSLSNRINARLLTVDTGAMLAPYLQTSVADGRYYPLSSNPAGYSILPNVVNSLQVINELGSPSIRSDVFANRPVAGNVGRIFISTDTKVIYRDNGTAWDIIGIPDTFLDSLFISPFGTINFGTSGDSVTADVNVSSNAGNILTYNGGLYVPSSISNGLLSGGIITWVTGLTYQISAAIYVINGVTYSSPARTFTLAAADPSLNRSDAIVVTIADTAGVITGIPNTPAVDPNVNPSSQLKIGNILVGAGTTAPTINVENIYLENTEWTTAVSNARINAASTNFPFAGTKDVEATAARNGDSVTFTKSGSVTTANFTTLTFQLRLKAAFTNSSAIILHFASGVNYTLSTGTVGSYAVVSIPLAAFAPLATTLGKLTVKVSTTGGRTIGFYIDNIQLQGAAATTTPPGNYVTNAGASISLTAGTFAARPTAGVLGRYYAAIGTSGNDSTFYYDNGSSWIPLFKTPVVPIIRVAYLGGTNGDSLVQANNGGDTLYSRRIRDSLGFHIVHNADGSETWYSSGGSGGLFGQSDVTATADRAFNANSHAFHIYNLPDLTFSLPNSGIFSVVDTPSNVINTIVPYSFGAGTSGGFDYHFTNLQGGPWGADILADSSQLRLSWGDGTNSGSYTVNSTSAEFSTTGAFFLSGSRYAFDGTLPDYLPSTDTTLSNPFLVGTDGKWHITDWASLRSALGSGQNIDQVLGVGDTAYGKTMYITNGAGTKTYESFGQNFFEAIGTDQDSASITVINSTITLVARNGLTFQGAGVHSTSGVTLKTQDADFTGDLMYFPNTTNLRDTLATKYDIRQAISGGGGSVTSFSAGNLSPLFTTSVATSTSTPALTFTLTNAAAHTLLGNNTGSSAAPSYLTTTQVTADLNLFSSSLQGLVPASGGGTVNFLRSDGTWAAPTGSATIGGSIASTQVGVGSGTNTISGSANFTYSSNLLTLLNNGLGATTSPGLTIANTNAAISGTQQVSPDLIFGSFGFGTTAGTSQAVNGRIYVVPTQSTVPTGEIDFGFSIAGGAYNTPFKILSNGSIVSSSTITSGAGYLATTGSPYSWNVANNSQLIGGDFNSTVSVRNSTAAQAVRIFNTFTSTTNYEAANLGFIDNTNVFTIATSKGTTGTQRGIRIDGSTAGIGIGATPGTSSFMNFAAGTTTQAPVIFASGTSLTTATAGSFEFDGTNFYLTPSTSRYAVSLAAKAAAPATTGTMTTTLTNLSAMTITPSGACTFNASGGVAGQECSFIVTTSGTSSFVLTFGTNFKTTGTLTTGATSAKVFTVNFVYDGTNWNEESRTTAM